MRTRHHTSCRQLALAHRVIADSKLEEVFAIAYKGSSLGLHPHTRYIADRVNQEVLSEKATRSVTQR